MLRIDCLITEYFSQVSTVLLHKPQILQIKIVKYKQIFIYILIFFIYNHHSYFLQYQN